MKRGDKKGYQYKLRILVYTLSIGFVYFAIIGYFLLNQINIHGNLFVKISANKDLIADILPPPSNLMESYLNFFEIMLEKNKQAKREKILYSLKLQEEYEKISSQWEQKVTDKKALELLKKSDLFAKDYFKKQNLYLILDSIYEPVYLAELNRLYNKHRKVIDQLSVYLKTECSNDEQKASNAIMLTIIGYIVFCIIVLIGIVVFVTNVSKSVIKEINEKQKARQNLESINKDKDRLLSILAHDIKNALNSIIGFSELLENDAKNKVDTDLQETASLIYNAGLETNKMLDNMLEWSKIQQGKTTIIKEKIELRKFFDCMVSSQSHIAQYKNITIYHELADNMFVSADKYTLEIILRNLINNAIKFTRESGSIKLNALDKGVFVEISVKDTGIGMIEEVVNRLFSNETNITTRGTKNERGTGLGLIICKEFINKQGGEISARSELGKGSEFIFTLPKA